MFFQLPSSYSTQRRKTQAKVPIPPFTVQVTQQTVSNHGRTWNPTRLPLHPPARQGPQCRNGLRRHCIDKALLATTTCYALLPRQPNLFVLMAEHNSSRLQPDVLHCSGPHRHGFSAFTTVVAPWPYFSIPDPNFWQDDFGQLSHSLIYHYQNLTFDRVDFALLIAHLW